MQSRFDIVSRAAVAAAVLVTALVNLCERTFNESTGAADKSHEPHPEDTARTAEANSRRNTDNISRTYAGRRRDHERLKGRNRFFFPRLFHDNANTLSEHT